WLSAPVSGYSRDCLAHLSVYRLTPALNKKGRRFLCKFFLRALRVLRGFLSIFKSRKYIFPDAGGLKSHRLYLYTGSFTQIYFHG
ncbi:MAG: hypothetical protein JXB44_10225, partial [Calditrichaceae bacterium]|nr:hypothetical protein [Calditrichaceae bacterium]